MKIALFDGKPIRKEILVFQKPVLGKNEINEVINTLKSGWLSTGPKVQILKKIRQLRNRRFIFILFN